MIDNLYIDFVTQCCPDNMKNQVLGVITDLSENPKVCVCVCVCACVHTCVCVILCGFLCIFVCHVQDMVITKLASWLPSD